MINCFIFSFSVTHADHRTLSATTRHLQLLWPLATHVPFKFSDAQQPFLDPAHLPSHTPSSFRQVTSLHSKFESLPSALPIHVRATHIPSKRQETRGLWECAVQWSACWMHLVRRQILHYQHPVTGLFPLHPTLRAAQREANTQVDTACNVRDSVYCALVLWALAQGYKYTSLLDQVFKSPCRKCTRGSVKKSRYRNTFYKKIFATRPSVFSPVD